MKRLSRFAAAVSLAFTALSLPVLAQPAPATSQPRSPSTGAPVSPASKGQSAKSLGGKGNPSGKMLTREELRSCLKRLDDITTGGKDLVQRRVALDAEKDELVKSGDSMKSLRADVDAKLAAVRAWEVRMRAHAAEIEAFNQRARAAEDAPKGEREGLLKALDAQRAGLTQTRATLTTDEAALVPAYESSVRSYNERAQARDALVTDWNARNKALNEAGEKTEAARVAWMSECANRPYRDEDEAAIKAGK